MHSGPTPFKISRSAAVQHGRIYLNDNFDLQKSVFAFLGDDERFAEEKDVTIAPAADDAEHILTTKYNTLDSEPN